MGNWYEKILWSIGLWLILTPRRIGGLIHNWVADREVGRLMSKTPENNEQEDEEIDYE